MTEYRVITEEGKEITRGSYAGCERYWNACNGIYEDENGEHYIHIEEVKELKEGFYKVAQKGSTYIMAIFYNPDTKEEFTKCVRDYDYADCSRDNDKLYYMQIDERVKNIWLHDNGVILKGDTVQVIKGRKVPIGTVAKVTDKRPYRDRYGRTQAMYLYLDNGMKTNENNCILVL